MAKKVGKVLTICFGDTIEDDFFAKWVDFMNPYCHLTKGEQRVFAAILRNRHILSSKIKDDDLLDKNCMNEESRAKMAEQLGLSATKFSSFVGKLKDKGVLSAVMKYGRVDYYKAHPAMIMNAPKEPLVVDMVFRYRPSDAEKA